MGPDSLSSNKHAEKDNEMDENLFVDARTFAKSPSVNWRSSGAVAVAGCRL